MKTKFKKADLQGKRGPRIDMDGDLAKAKEIVITLELHKSKLVKGINSIGAFRKYLYDWGAKADKKFITENKSVGDDLMVNVFRKQ